jgi:xanthine dehydrogenase YagR molybdenum-binding subunit
MKFDKPAEANPIDRMQVVGRAHPRIDGHLKTTGKAPYAYEHHDVVTNPAYGVIVGSAIGKGRIVSKSLAETERASGVLAVVTAENAGKLGKGKFNTAKLLGGPDIDHYHQAIAVVVAETFEQATAAAALIRVEYAPADGRFDLEEALKTAPLAKDPNSPEKDAPPESRTGDFEKAFAQAPVKLDELYTTPDQSHSMMEPHASIAVWNGDKLTVWTSNQMIDWGRTDLATTLGIPKENVRFVSPYIGNGRAGGEGVRPAGQSRVTSAVHSEQYYTPPRHPTAHPDRGGRGWAHHCNRARKRLRRSPRRSAGDGDQSNETAVCRP